jgi:ATP-dependent DNA ligase
VIGGYTPAGRNFDAILIGDYEGRALQYVAKVHGGFTPALRASVFKKFDRLETTICRSRTCPNRGVVTWAKD